MSATAAERDGTPPRPFVGRGAELNELHTAVAQPPHLAVVEGEAGVGKTRLVLELARDPNRRFLVGRCYPVREAFPLASVVEALRGVRGPWQRPLSVVAGALRSLLPELADQLPASPEPLGDVSAERYRLFRGTIDLLGALGPAVLVVEDMHWADEGTCDLATLLAQSLPPDLALVLSYRAHDLAPAAPFRMVLARLPAGTARFVLQPLDAAAVRELTGALLGAPEVSEQFAQLLWERTGGVPFAVEEVLALLRGRNDLVHRDGRWVRRTVDELEVPAAVRDTVLERLGRLGGDARAVAEAAAVWGGAVEEAALTELAGLSAAAAAAALSEAMVAAMLRDDGGCVDFRHALARQAVYDGVPGPKRRLLHTRSAELLARRDDQAVTRLAHHHQLAGHTTEWVAAAEAAADRVAAGGDVLSAAAFVEDAAAAAGVPLDVRVRLALKLAAWARHGVRFERPVQVLQDLLAEPDLSAAQRGELRASLGMVVLRYDVAGLADLQAALPDLAHRPDLYARALSTLSIPRLSAATVTEQLEWSERAVSVATGHDDAEARVAVLVDRSALLGGVGDRRFRESLDALPHPGAGGATDRQLLRATINAVESFTGLGYYDEAREWAVRADRLFDELAEERDSYLGQSFAVYRLVLRWSRGELDGLADEVGQLLERALTHGVLEHLSGRLLALHGDLAGAERRLRQAIELLSAEADLRGGVDAAGGLADLLLARGVVEEARAAVEPALDTVRRKAAWAWAVDLAAPAVDALLAADCVREAEELRDDLAAGLADRDAPAGVATLDDVRGRLAERAGDATAATRHHDAAARSWRALPNPRRAAAAAESAGRAGIAGGSPEAVARLETAYAGFRQLGATWDANRVAAALREAGAVVPHRRGRRGYGPELSPREREVAGLLADGLSNRQIAETLFLSRRTAEAHVARVMRKLGARSRSDVGADGAFRT